LYTGTLIKDLLGLGERAEHAAALRASTTFLPAAASNAGMVDKGKTRTGRGNSETEKLPQPLGLSAADWNLALLLVIHAQLIRTLEPGHDFTNSIDVHQVGAVSAPEQGLIQTGE